MPDPLELVRNELEARRGDLRKLAHECPMAYDTILRIKNREGDPGYEKVRKLYRCLFDGDLSVPPPSA